MSPSPGFENGHEVDTHGCAFSEYDRIGEEAGGTVLNAG